MPLCIKSLPGNLFGDRSASMSLLRGSRLPTYRIMYCHISHKTTGDEIRLEMTRETQRYTVTWLYS